MVCRHSAGDPNCGSSPEGARRNAHAAAQYAEKKARTEERKKKRDALTPDADKFQIKGFLRVGRLIVMRVEYPNCDLCAHDGTKIMIFEHITEMEMIQLKRIDPHFRPRGERTKGEARSPVARFPGDDVGWRHALAFAKLMEKQ